MASFNGKQIGILQSLREIPGLLAFSVVLVLFFIHQQKLVYLSMILLGAGTALTGYFPTPMGLYTTTIVMSLGFHYLATLNQSLSLQWLEKKTAPIILGKINAVRSFVGLFVFVAIYTLIKYLHMDYQHVYLIFGCSTMFIGLHSWVFFAHFGERLALRLEYIGLIVIFTSYAWVHDLHIAYGLYMLDNLLFSMAIALKTYFQKIADPKDIATASAVSFTINHIAAVFLPALLGLLWLHSYASVFLIGTGVGVLSLILSFFIPENPEKGFETILQKIATSNTTRL